MRKANTARCGILVGIAGVMAIGPAQAFEFEYGELYGSLKNRVSLGASWRLEQRDERLIDKNNLNPSLCGSGVDDACISFNGNNELNQKLVDAPGSHFALNKDDGNLNYDQGDIVAAVSKLTSELSMTWGDFVFKAGGTAFFDTVNYDFDEYHPDTTYQPRRTKRDDTVAVVGDVDGREVQGQVTDVAAVHVPHVRLGPRAEDPVARAILEAAEGKPDSRAALAVAVFCYRVRKYIGAYLAVLGGADALIFGGGIGERSAVIRARICEGLRPLARSCASNCSASWGTRFRQRPAVQLAAFVLRQGVHEIHFLGLLEEGELPRAMGADA